MAISASSSLRAEYQALSRERDSELRCEGLLALAGRQERQHRPELAVEIYSELLQDPEISTSVSRRAQARLGALRGEGELGARAEVLFSRFNDEVTEPTSLLAMATAGLAFRATRFITLGRLASSPAGILTRGTGARALAGLAGFGVEATVFPMASRLGNVALGRELDWSGSTISSELISSFMTLGALRAGGLATGALANRSSLFRPAIQQAGMFGGIVLGHELEARAGLRERTSGSIALLDSLVTLLHFNVAGRLSRSLMGEGLRSWEHRIEQQTQSLGNNPWRLPTLPSLELSSGLVPVGARPGLEISPEPFGPDRVYMTQDGEGGGNGNGNGKGPRRRDASNNTLPFITLPGIEQSPYYVEHPLEIGRRIRNPALGFKERIQAVDVEFQVKSIFDAEPFVEPLRDQLNGMLSQGLVVENGRKFILNIHPTERVQAKRIVLERGPNGFTRIDSASSEPPVSPLRGIDPTARTEFAMPAISLPRTETTLLRAVKARPPHRTLVIDRIELVPALLRQLAEHRENGHGTPVLILEGRALGDVELKELTKDLGPALPETASFDLMIPESEATWSGMRLGDNVHWSRLHSSQLTWQTAKFHAVQPKIAVPSVGELYQQIFAISRHPARAADAETTLQLIGTVPPNENPVGLTLDALNRYRVAGRRFRLELENEVSHEFLGDQGRWQGAEAPRPASKPASRPPIGGPVEYHSARWRSSLNQFLQNAPQISGANHEFYLLSQVPLAANDIQAICTRLQLGSGQLESLRIHDQASQKLWIFQRQNGEWRGEEGVWESQVRWRPFENHPAGAIEAANLMDLLRQIPATIHGTQALHISMQGPWSAQYAASFIDGLNQAQHPHSSLRPQLVLHYVDPEAGPRRQVYQRTSIGEWHFWEESEGT